MRRKFPLKYSLRESGRAHRCIVLLGALLAALLVPSCGAGGGGHRHRSPELPASFSVNFRSPSPGTTNVARTAFIVVGCDRPVNALTVNSSTFTLSTGGATVQSNVTFQSSNQVATLEPNAVLLPDTTYTVALTSGILDENGNPLIPDSFTFTTGAFTDVTRPNFAGATAATVIGGEGAVTLAAATDNLDMSADIVFDVFVSTTTGTFNFGSPQVTTPPGVLQAILLDVSNSAPTFFVVRARDRSGNTDLNTHEVMLGTQNQTISFSGSVWPIVAFHCQSCHTIGIGAQQVPNMILSSPTATFLAWVNVDAWCGALPPGSKRVLPGSS